MNRTFITGDTHGYIDSSKFSEEEFPIQVELDKSDVVIICGDAGFVWDGGKGDEYIQKAIAEKPFTTLCCLGNHENYGLISQLPTVDMYGGKWWKVNDSIYYAQHGEIYTINGNSFFFMNGARSTDKHLRRENISWWEAEIPTSQQFNHGIENLDKYFKNHIYLDYIITHDCPRSISNFITRGTASDAVTSYFEFINNNRDYNFGHWFFGHHHTDCIIDTKHTVLYNHILEITPDSSLSDYFNMINVGDLYRKYQNK